MILKSERVICDYTDREEAMEYILSYGGRIEDEVRDGVPHFLVVI